MDGLDDGLVGASDLSWVGTSKLGGTGLGHEGPWEISAVQAEVRFSACDRVALLLGLGLESTLIQSFHSCW